MQTDYNKVIIKAMSEIHRHQVLVAKLNPNTENMYPHAYVYAVLHRVCPAYDNHPDTFEEAENPVELIYRFPFEGSYEVRRDQVVKIAELLDEKWRSKEKITYYDLEDTFGRGVNAWDGGHMRPQLITICRYLFLHGMFDDKFWKDFMSNHASEASDITDAWDTQEIIDWAAS